MYIESFKQHFSAIDDHRQSAKVTYPLFDILFGSLCAVIASSNGWFEIREYILGHHSWFKKQKMFIDGIPADDTIARIVSMIDPDSFNACFLAWMKSVHQLTNGEVIAIDGKTLRGSYNRDDRSSTIHMISAYASANKLVLGQLKAEQKSNEITAIPTLLKMLDLRGALVTIDAMGCQTAIADTIIDKGGDYLLAVKNNQGNLAKAVNKAFSSHRSAGLSDDHVNIETGHGRIENRTCYVLSSAALDGDFTHWEALKSIVMVESFRAVKGKTASLEYRYYISSKVLSAEQALSATREHWGIESMHWVLDVSMNEDACQIYKNNGAENLAYLRHMSLNMLQKEPTKLSIVGKRKRCLMNPEFLEKVLIAGLCAPTK
jgi:predicted transposase YbfD/YdcC